MSYLANERVRESEKETIEERENILEDITEPTDEELKELEAEEDGGHKNKILLDGRGKHPNSRKNLKLGGFKKEAVVRERNVNWKGEQASYTAHHHWLRYWYGKASKCQNADCIFPRKVQRRGITLTIIKPSHYQWALLKGKKHSQKRENYIQLCPSCHEKYDKGSRITITQ